MSVTHTYTHSHKLYEVIFCTSKALEIAIYLCSYCIYYFVRKEQYFLFIYLIL